MSFKAKQIFQMLRTRFHGDQKVICALMTEKAEDLVVLSRLVEADRFRPCVDRTFPLEQAAAAHRYAESPEKKGNVVITIP